MLFSHHPHSQAQEAAALHRPAHILYLATGSGDVLAGIPRLGPVEEAEAAAAAVHEVNRIETSRW